MEILEKIKNYWIVAIIFLALPIPLVLVWMVLDGATYRSWKEVLSLALFTYLFELVFFLWKIFISKDEEG